MQRQVQRPQSVVSHPRADNEHVTHSVHKDSKGRGKLNPTPPPSPVKLPLKSVSCLGSSGGEERRAPNGLLDIQQQATPNPGDTFSVCGEKQMSDVYDKDDTMELLQQADMQSPNVEMEGKGAAFSIPERTSAHIENIRVAMDSKNDTMTLVKRAPTQHLYTSEIQVSAEFKLSDTMLFSH